MRKSHFTQPGFTIYLASVMLEEVNCELGSDPGYINPSILYVIAQDLDSAILQLKGYFPVGIKKVDLIPAQQQDINAYVHPESWAGYTEAMDKLATVRHEVRRFCYLRNWSDSVELLDASLARANEDQMFAERLTSLLLSESPTTLELRDLMEVFGRYGSAGRRETFPHYPHTDAVNGIDSALMHYRLGDIDEVLQSEGNAASTLERDFQFIRMEVRRCCMGLDWNDALTLLGQAEARAESDTGYAGALKSVIESEQPQTGALREIMEHFGRFGAAGIQATYPFCPHTDAVNRLDTAIHFVRIDAVDKQIEEARLMRDLRNLNNQ